MNIEDRLARSRIQLMLEHPFFGYLAMQMNMQIVEDDHLCATAATDGITMIFNKSFCEKQSDEQLQFVVAHESLHVVFEHTSVARRNGRDPQLWNIAGDIVINQCLIDEKIGAKPTEGVFAPELYKKGNAHTEGVYALLEKQVKQQLNVSASGNSGSGMPKGKSCKIKDGPKDKNMEEIAKIRISQAIKNAQDSAERCKSAGLTSVGLKRLIDQLLKPRVDWRNVLQEFIIRTKTDNRTWARPNRRFASRDLYLPSRTGECVGDLVFAVDCSGSISNKELTQFASEIKHVQLELNPTKIHIVYFDSNVCNYNEFEQGEEVEISPRGGGGTAFSPVFRFINEQAIECVACVFLTDLCCDDFGPPPDYPVLWVSTEKNMKVPFGQIVEMNDV